MLVVNANNSHSYTIIVTISIVFPYYSFNVSFNNNIPYSYSNIRDDLDGTQNTVIVF